MRRPWIWALGAAVVLAGAVGWTLRGSDPLTVPASVDGDAPPPSATVGVVGSPDRRAPVATEPSSDGDVLPAVEAVADPKERLPEIRVGDRGRVARFRPQVFRDGTHLLGEVLLAGVVEGRDVWVRWDAEATRERFVRQRFPVPGMNVLPNGDAVVFLEPMPAVFRHFGFSCRLEGSVLRIGGEGVYPPDDPVPPADAPPPDPSPR